MKNPSKQLFTDKVKGQLGKYIYLIQGKYCGRKAWAYIMVKKNKIPLLKHKIAHKNIDLTLLGDVLYSGWGDTPPNVIINQLKQDYT